MNGNGSVYVISQSGTVNTYATGLGPLPSGLAFDSHGNLFVSSNLGGRYSTIYKVSPSGAVSTFASGLAYAFSMAIDRYDNLYVCDLYYSPRYRRLIPPAQWISTTQPSPTSTARRAWASTAPAISSWRAPAALSTRSRRRAP